MKTHRVYFFFRPEEYGNFDSAAYSVEAEDVFEARRVARAVRNADGEMIDDDRSRVFLSDNSIVFSYLGRILPPRKGRNPAPNTVRAGIACITHARDSLQAKPVTVIKPQNRLLKRA
jgi:hypothetical protein